MHLVLLIILVILLFYLFREGFTGLNALNIRTKDPIHTSYLGRYEKNQYGEDIYERTLFDITWCKFCQQQGKYCLC